MTAGDSVERVIATENEAFTTFNREIDSRQDKSLLQKVRGERTTMPQLLYRLERFITNSAD